MLILGIIILFLTFSFKVLYSLFEKFCLWDRIIMFFDWSTTCLSSPNSLSFTWHMFTVWQILSSVINSNEVSQRQNHIKARETLYSPNYRFLFFVFLRLSWAYAVVMRKHNEMFYFCICFSGDHNKKNSRCFTKIFRFCLLPWIILITKGKKNQP